MRKAGYNFMYKFRNNLVIRRIYQPFGDFMKRCDHERYLRTADSWYLKTLKGIHTGKRCFIIGNGPSLLAEDLDQLKGEYTFAANRIFKIFDQTNWRPTYYLSVDDRVMKDIGTEFLNYDLGHMFLGYHKCPIKAPSNQLTRIYERGISFNSERKHYNDTTLYVSVDVSNHFGSGASVSFCSIQLAIYMGFAEIYLLGVDNNYSHTIDTSGNVHIDPSVKNYFGETDARASQVSYPFSEGVNLLAYTLAKEYCDNHGIIIKNATRGGKLEVFERVDFDELMQQQAKKG